MTEHTKTMIRTYPPPDQAELLKERNKALLSLQKAEKGLRFWQRNVAKWKLEVKTLDEKLETWNVQGKHFDGARE